MKCPECQTDNRDGARFCVGCGSELKLLCPHCGQHLPASAKFCDHCGKSVLAAHTPSGRRGFSAPTEAAMVAAEGERKVVTVLFADTANYTAMSEKLDPEEVHQIIDQCVKLLTDIVNRYGGTITQFTGDGIMALFGAPFAREDHAQRACHSALAIQQALEGYGAKIRQQYDVDFVMRIGINSGLAIVGSVGSDLHV
jgi:class 3 adenylate cyclase